MLELDAVSYRYPGYARWVLQDVSLRLEDFELDIVDYLQDGGERCELAEVANWFRGRQEVATAGSQPLLRLLEDVQTGRVPQAAAEWLIPRLERTLNSFAQLHGPGPSD